MNGVTYDTGALVAAEAGRAKVWEFHAWAVGRQLKPIVPAAVLGQAWRGGPQARLSRLLRGCRVESLDEARSRAAGAALARAGTADVVDASVVVGAIARRDTIVTSDPRDIERLLEALGVRLRVMTV